MSAEGNSLARQANLAAERAKGWPQWVQDLAQSSAQRRDTDAEPGVDRTIVESVRKALG